MTSNLYHNITNLYAYSAEIIRVSKQINKLSYHVSRCKKTEDSIKLIVMICIKSAYINVLLNSMNKNLK